MNLRFIDIINFITAFQLLFFSIFLFAKRKGNTISHKILASFFLVQSSCILNSYIWHFYSFFYNHFPHVFYVAETLLFLWGPLLYLYTVSVIKKGFKLRLIHLIHIIPFFLHFCYMFVVFYQFNTETKQQLLNQGVLNKQVQTTINIIFHVLIVYYIIAALISLQQAYKKFKHFYSNIEELNFKWLNYVLIGFAIIGLITVLLFVLPFFGIIPTILSKIVYPFIFILANFMVYFALNQPELFVIESPEKYKKSNLSASQKMKYLDKIEKILEDEKLYKNPYLTINDLSKKLSISSRYISQVINEYKNQNFYDFINKFRINEACELLKQYSTDLTILEILYEVGFNTKSSFNMAFKKMIKTTPTEFIKRFSN